MTRFTLCGSFMLSLFFCPLSIEAVARQQAAEPAKNGEVARTGANAGANANARSQPASSARSSETAAPTVDERLRAMEQLIERQQQEIRELRALVERITPANAAARPDEAARSEAAQPQAIAVSHVPASGKSEAAGQDATQKKVEELYKKFGAIRLSGDIRLRLEMFRNQGFDSLVEPPSRNRLRVRARLALDGALNKSFDWGIKLATGFFTDPVSSNQNLTDFYNRKPFALERFFVRYDSKGDTAGVQLVGGKFEPTFRRTQMMWDDDVNVEGASEAVYFKTKSSLSQVKLVALQLPFNEVSAGKDGVVYGGQLQTDWKWTPAISANVNVAYYAWNHADQVLFGLGASATQAGGGINGGSGITGGQNGALGTTNRVIRNASGAPVGLLANFNLFDVLGNLTWQARARVPVTFTFDYVRNLSSRIKDEKNGYWAGVQLGQTREKGDWLAGYAFTRIEQDAVLVPFNFSDILASNSRVHMPTFAYQVADGVTLQWTGLFSQRANKVVLLSPVNRWLNRLQFDVIYKF